MKVETQSSNKPAEQIDRYVYEVTRRLPEKQRKDINQELHSLIEDMVQDRFPEKELTVEDINIVLKQLGNPLELADKYREKQRYLIGPEYYDLYFFILKIVLSAVLFGIVVAMIVGNLVTPPANISKVVTDVLSAAFGGIFQAFAWVTVIFAVLSRYGESISGVHSFKAEMAKSKEWDPSCLPEVPAQKARIKKSEPIVGIVLSVLFLIFVNSAIQVVGVIFITGDGTRIIPIFDPAAIREFLALINVILILGVVKELIRLFVGKYTLQLSLGIFVLSAISLVLTILVFTNPEIWNHNFVSELNSVFAAKSPEIFNRTDFWTIVYRCFIGIAIFGFAVETLSNFTKSIRYRVAPYISNT